MIKDTYIENLSIVTLSYFTLEYNIFIGHRVLYPTFHEVVSYYKFQSHSLQFDSNETEITSARWNRMEWIIIQFQPIIHFLQVHFKSKSISYGGIRSISNIESWNTWDPWNPCDPCISGGVIRWSYSNHIAWMSYLT